VGFASPDSDYDVRFIYIRPQESCLKLEHIRDVIELPLNDVLDIKVNSPEVKLMPRVDELNRYFDESIVEIHEKIERLPKEPMQDWAELDRRFFFAFYYVPALL